MNGVYTPPLSDTCSGLYPLHESDVLSISNRHFRLSLPNKFDSNTFRPTTPERNESTTTTSAVQIDTPANNNGKKRRIRMSLVQNAAIQTPANKNKRKSIKGNGVGEKDEKLEEVGNDQVEGTQEEAQDIVVMEELDEDEDGEAEENIQQPQQLSLEPEPVPMDLDEPLQALAEAPTQSNGLAIPLDSVNSSPSPSPSKSNSSSPSKQELKERRTRRSSAFFGRASVKSMSGEKKTINYEEDHNDKGVVEQPPATSSPKKTRSPSKKSSPSKSKSQSKILSSNENSILNSNSEEQITKLKKSNLFDSPFKTPRLPSSSTTPKTSPTKIPDPSRPLTHSPSKNRRISLRTEFFVRRSEEVMEERLRLEEEIKEEQARLDREDYERKLKEKKQREEEEMEKKLTELNDNGDESSREELERKRREELEQEDEDEVNQSLSFSFSNDDVKETEEMENNQGSMSKSSSSDDFSTKVKSPLSESPAKESVEHQQQQPVAISTPSLNAFSTPQPKKVANENKGKKSRKSTGTIRRVSIGRSNSGSFDNDWMSTNGISRSRSIPDGLASTSHQAIEGEESDEINEVHRDGETSRALEALCEEAEGHETDSEEEDDEDEEEEQIQEVISPIKAKASTSSKDSTSMPPPQLASSTPISKSRSSISVRAANSLKKAGRRSSTSFYVSKDVKSDSPEKIGNHGGLLKEDALAALKHVLYSSAHNRQVEAPDSSESTVEFEVKSKEQTPKYGGLREMMKQVPDAEALLSLKDKGKNKHQDGQTVNCPSTPDMRGLKQMLQEPKVLATPNMEGLKNLMQPSSSPIVNQVEVPSTPSIPSSSSSSKKPRKSFKEQDRNQSPDLNFLKHVFTLPPSIIEQNSDLKKVRDLFEAHEDELTSLTPRPKEIDQEKARSSDLRTLLNTPAAKRIIVKAASSALKDQETTTLEGPSSSVDDSISSPALGKSNSKSNTALDQIKNDEVTSFSPKISNSKDQIQSSEKFTKEKKQPRKSLGESLGVIGANKGRKSSKTPLDSSSSSPFRSNSSSEKKDHFKEPLPISSGVDNDEHERNENILSSSPSKDAARRKSSRKSGVKEPSSSSPSKPRSSLPSSRRKSKVVKESDNAVQEDQDSSFKEPFSSSSISLASLPSGKSEDQSEAHPDDVQQDVEGTEEQTEAEPELEPEPISTRRPKRGAALAASTSIAALSSSPIPSSTSSSRSKRSTKAGPSSENAKEVVDNEQPQDVHSSSSSSNKSSSRGRSKAKTSTKKVEQEELDEEDGEGEGELEIEILISSPVKKGRPAKSKQILSKKKSSSRSLRQQAVEEEPVIEGREEEEKQEIVDEIPSSTVGTTKLTRSKSKSSTQATSSPVKRSARSKSRSRSNKDSEEVQETHQDDQEEEEEVSKPKKASTRSRSKSSRSITSSDPAESVVNVDAPRATRATRSRAVKK